ncbi:ATP-binding cassette domain-containing protein, partial [Bordetella hinzii]|nr:ATP-binding cassette domain-containing protein [Bordetella hinzii]
MTSPLIDIRDLRLATSATPSRELLKGLSLTLRAGEVLGIIGESGAGKSTLGLAALGHLRAGVRHAGGQVLYRGQDLLAMPLAQRNRLLGR